MSSEVVDSQRLVMRKAAEIANKIIRAELDDPASPITQVITKKWIGIGGWRAMWNPYIVNWSAKSGFGLALRDSDAFALSTVTALTRVEEITIEAMTVAMRQKAKEWIGPMLRDLMSKESFYAKLVGE